MKNEDTEYCYYDKKIRKDVGMETSVSNSKIIKEIVKLFRPFKWKALMVIACITVSSGLNLLVPILSQKLMDDGLILKDNSVIIKSSIFILMLMILIQAISIIETRYQTYIENILSFTLEKNAIYHMLKMKISFFNDTNYAQTMSNLKTDIGKITSLCDRNTFYMLTSVFRIAVGIIGLFLISWKLSFLVLFITPVRYLLVKFLSKKRHAYFKDLIQLYQDYDGWQGDTFAGIKEVKSWCLESLKMREFIKLQRKIIRQNMKVAYLQNTNMISETIFGEVLSTFMYIVGGSLVTGGTLTVGKLFAFMTYSSYVTGPIFAIMNMRYIFAGIMPSAQRYFEFLHTECEEPKKIGQSFCIDAKQIRGKIEFRNVSFSYKENDPILQNVNLKIAAGEHVAIIGRNGSGKSTILNLIMRFLSPDSGQILLDDRNVMDINLHHYRTLIAVVSQEVYLFNSSIKENIMLNAKKTEEEFHVIAQICGVDRFVSKIPDQYDSIVGERGGKLSGGERQKIAMARAFIKESKILILDEATANYDVKSEQEINHAIMENYKDKTMIIITHKPDILKMMDKIFVMNHGCMEDVGSHAELYKRNSFYREMMNKSEGMLA